jgi:hypothetical protein
MLTWITPAHMQFSVQALSTAGWLPIKTLGTPGTQGEAVAGTQGIGVNTPKAAAVAAATVGLEGLVHMPKGMMFSMGMWSMMLAAGMLLVRTRLIGNTTSVLGAAPKLHMSVAPLQTCSGIDGLLVESWLHPHYSSGALDCLYRLCRLILEKRPRMRPYGVNQMACLLDLAVRRLT